MRIRDSIMCDANSLTRTNDGYLVGPAKIARAGNVQMYLGRELGLTGDAAEQSYGVYRDPDVVFDKSSMLTLAGRPVTINHPDEPVTADNHKALSVGHIGGSVARDGEHIVAQMVITDADAVELAENGSRWLSAGYLVDTIPSEGVSPGGVPYQFKQSGKVTFNHVALLDGKKPRAGNTRFGDSQKDSGKDCTQRWGVIPTLHQDGGSAMTDKTQTFVRDGLSVDMPSSALQLVQKLFADADKQYEDMKAKYDALKKDIAEKQGKLDALQADMDKMKDNAPDDAKLDKLADERAKIKSDAKTILGDSASIDDLSNTEIKTAVVKKALGDQATAVLDSYEDDTQRAAYIDGAYGLAIRDAQSNQNKTDPFRNTIKDGVQPMNDADALWDSVLGTDKKEA